MKRSWLNGNHNVNKVEARQAPATEVKRPWLNDNAKMYTKSKSRLDRIVPPGSKSYVYMIPGSKGHVYTITPKCKYMTSYDGPGCGPGRGSPSGPFNYNNVNVHQHLLSITTNIS